MENNALVDSAWLDDLAESRPENNDGIGPIWARAKMPQTKLEENIRKVLSNSSGSGARYLRFLESIITFENIFADSRSVSPRHVQLPEGTEEYLHFVDMENANYAAAIEKIKELQNSGVPAIETIFNSYAYYDGYEESWADNLFSEHLGIPGLGVLANTNNSPHRAVFFMELAQVTGLTPLLSSEKTRLLHDVGMHLSRAIHQVVENIVETELRDIIRDNISECEELSSYEFDVPPLGEMIIRNAVRDKRGLFDTAVDIRESEGAQAYRKFLGSFVSEQYDTRPGRVEANREKVREIESILSEWNATGDFSIGVKYNLRKISISKLPFVPKEVGAFVNAVSADGWTIKDPYLIKPKTSQWLSFISDWYQH